MLFHTFQFFFFFIIVFSLYLVLPHRWQNRMLLVASYVFYGAWDWRYLSLLFFSTITDYLCALQIDRTQSIKVKKGAVVVSVIVNLTLLFTFKYYDFFAENFKQLMGYFGLVVHPYFLNVALPVGISFYTFQTLCYTIDVYRKRIPAARNFIDFALYVSFFPQLVAGPIERGTRLLPQILKPRVITREKVMEGLHLFYFGLVMKVLIADNLGDLVDSIFAANGPYYGGMIILGVYGFAFQIFCDFAGYSLMAIGLGLMLGINLMENFRRPYFSKNISDFWRRWHISLSSWFRDYVFSPFFIYLQGHAVFKKFSFRAKHAVSFFITLFTAEFLLGLWHGAGWNYALFGVYHALMIWLYYYLRRFWDRLNIYFQIFLTFQLACYGWLIFRAQSMAKVWSMTHDLLFNWRGVSTEFLNALLKFCLPVALLLAYQVFEERKNDRLVIYRLPLLIQIFIYVAMGCLIMWFGKMGERRFIYFQF